MNLWEIDAEIQKALDAAVDPETGEVNEEAYKAVTALEMRRDEKIENTALYIKNIRAYAKAVDDEIKNLQAMKKAAERKADGAEGYLVSYLDGEKYTSARTKISYRRSQSVNIVDLFRIPDEYLKRKDPDADKTAIKKALAAGKEVPGAELLNKVNIQIK